MKTLFSCAELAEMQLPGLPKTKKGLIDLVGRESWPKQKRTGRGGGFEYQPPKEVLRLINNKQLATSLAKVEPSTVVVSESPLAIEDMTAHQREVGQARETLINFVEGYAGSVDTALQWLNNEYAAGAINAGLKFAIEHSWDKPRTDLTLTRSTYNKWLKAKRTRGIAAPLKVQKALTLKPWHPIAIELKRRPQGSSMKWLHSEIEKQFPAVSYHQITRFFSEEFSAIDQLKGRFTGSQLRSHRFYQHRTSEGLLPGYEVHADGWNTHFTAPHPITGEYVTYEVWHFHDVATRFVSAPGIGLTENFEVIAKGLENFIHQFGVPLIVQTDSTKVVRGSARFTKDPVRSLEEIIGCTVVHPKEVGNSQANGICENFNSSWLDARAKELATYQHESMDKLSFKRVKKITADMVKAANKGDLIARDAARRDLMRHGKGLIFDTHQQAVEWINQVMDEFNDKPHRSLPKIRCSESGRMRHQTPREAVQQHIEQGWQPTWMGGSREAQNVLIIDAFRPKVIKTVNRETVSPYGGMRYRHDDLGHWNGKEVVVSYDIHDYEHVWVSDKKGELICIAEFVAATGYRAMSAYEDALEKRAKAQIRLRERQIEKIQARTPGLVIEAEKPATIIDFISTEKPKDADLVSFRDFQTDNKTEELGSFHETVMQLYGDKEDLEATEDEVVAR